MSAPDPPRSTRIRREPPQFRVVEVQRVERLGPRMVSVTFGGESLEGLTVDEPAASVRLLLPSPGVDELVMPSWNGNEFLLPDGGRPIIRTFTPYRVDAYADASTLELWVVLHGDGPASDWAAAAQPGDAAAISGPGRGYTVDRDAPAFLLAGDETAIPAIRQLLDVMPDGTPVQVHVEVGRPTGRIALPESTRTTVTWHDLPPDAAPGDALVAAVVAADIPADARVWVAGEAAAVHRIRRNLFEDRGLVRARTTVRGYWKHGRGGDPD